MLQALLDATGAQLAVVSWHAPWVLPCSALKPGLDRLAAAHPGALLVLRLDVEGTAANQVRDLLAGCSSLISNMAESLLCWPCHSLAGLGTALTARCTLTCLAPPPGALPTAPLPACCRRWPWRR